MAEKDAPGNYVGESILQLVYVCLLQFGKVSRHFFSIFRCLLARFQLYRVRAEDQNARW